MVDRDDSAERYLFLAVEALARDGREEDYLIEAMRTYGDLRIAEYRETQRREADSADIYARYQRSLPLDLPEPPPYPSA